VRGPHPKAQPGKSGALVGFDDVHFAYAAGEPVLRGVSFDIPSGATVAVVGATGSGKSTLIKLLTRLYELERGAVRLGGVDVRDLSVQELRRRITVVSQDVFLFTGTVAENIRGGTDASREKIEAAVERVGADRALVRRPEGLETKVADRGGNFSAGERQLLAFARAMVRDPEVLVLDEATAHVDPESEALIERGIKELMRGRTTLVIAHRLSTIRNADLILVMSHGQIVERGTHDQLVAQGGVYAALERTFSRRD
jgi:ATP-binding cassette subfamily B protein